MKIWNIQLGLRSACLALCLLSFACANEPLTPEAEAEAETEGAGEQSEAYAIGSVEQGLAGFVQVELTESTPSLKYVGKYTWLLTLRDKDGALINDAEISAEPTMPSHGHGTFPPFTEASFQGEGRYELVEMDLFMPGVWHIELSVQWGDDEEDALTYEIDLQG